MNLVLFIGGLDIGGAQRQVAVLADALNRARHTVTVVTLFPGGVHYHALRSMPGLTVEALWQSPGATRIVRLLQIVWSPVRFRSVVNRNRPTHVYSMLYLTNLIAWLATRWNSSCALVWGVRASDQEVNWKAAVPNRICARLSKRTQGLIANSHSGMNYHLGLGYKPQWTAVIPNGIDVRRFTRDQTARNSIRRRLKIPERGRLIGIVARNDPRKDHLSFIKAAALLVKRRTDLSFVSVGFGEHELRPDLAAAAADPALRGRVFWLEPRTDLSGLYSAMDLLVSSSTTEGFSNVIAEAMSCETPCIATDVGDSALIVGPTGTMVPPRDPEAMAYAIENLLREDLVIRGRQARSRIVRHFSIESLATRTESALEQKSALAVPQGTG